MMADELLAAIGGLVERLRVLAAEDPQLRAHLRHLAQAFLATTEAAEAVEAAPPAETASAVAEVAAVETEVPALLLGTGPAPSAAERPAWKTWSSVTDADLPLIQARCRIKAEGARWAAERERRLQAGAEFATEIEPKDREIIEKAKAIEGCFLWMNHSSGPSPEDLSLWDDVAGCFDTLAAGLALVGEILDDLDGNREVFEQSLDLLAEAHSALRVAIEHIDGSVDNDQKLVHNWLRATTREQQVFIQRYMRADDPADPTAWSSISERIEQLDLQLQKGRQQEKQQQARLNKIRYHLKSVRSGGGSDHDWKTIVDTVEAMIADGLQPSNREIRELLLPVVDNLPEMDLPPGFQRALQELDRYLATRPSVVAEVTQEPTAEVRGAAELLRGRNVVLIGGDRRPYAQEALRETFGLKELVWLDTREHQSIEGFEPYVARPDVAVVLLAIRWSSHSFGEVKDFCDKHGKPLVRLPSGYNPNQVAFQVLAQCGERLQAGSPP
jgi:hypothetical protein